MNHPTKTYQLWWNTGEGFAFEEFDDEKALADFVTGGNPHGRFFITRLLDFDVRLSNWYPPKVEGFK